MHIIQFCRSGNFKVLVVRVEMYKYMFILLCLLYQYGIFSNSFTVYNIDIYLSMNAKVTEILNSKINVRAYVICLEMSKLNHA